MQLLGRAQPNITMETPYKQRNYKISKKVQSLRSQIVPPENIYKSPYTVLERPIFPKVRGALQMGQQSTRTKVDDLKDQVQFLKKYQNTFESRSKSNSVKGSFFKYQNKDSPNLFDPRLRSSPKSQIDMVHSRQGSLPATIIHSETEENLFLTKEQKRYLNKH